MKNLLFITHDLTRTGAPILLLYLINWLQENKKEAYNITLLAVKGGELLTESNTIVKTIVLNKNNKRDYKIPRINSYFKRKAKYKVFEYLKNQNFDLIFSNTIVNGRMLERFAKANIPIISYVHELEYSIALYFKRGVAQGTLKYSTIILCGSALVEKTLIDKFEVSKEKTKVVYSFTNIKARKKDAQKAIAVKKELDLPKDSFIVAMAGTFDWRKGNDIFVKTAALLNKENIYFLWIGAKEGEELKRIKYDIEKSNSKAKLLFIPPTSDYIKYFNMIDVFYLSSREDPYPLVMVDATSFGIPVICFENAGGTQEFIDSKTGFVILYGNIEKAAEKLLFYYKNRDVLIENEGYIKEKSKNNHDLTRNAEMIARVIENTINS